jgi:hypothetical protein
MVSLLHLADINEEGVTFQSPTDGKRMLLTPEHSIQVSPPAAGRVGAGFLCPALLTTPSLACVPASVSSPGGLFLATKPPPCPPTFSPPLQVQNRLGADIIMALDDVVPSTAADDARFEEATHRTTRWIDRCIAAHSRPHQQNLFAIVQVGARRQEQGGPGWPCAACAGQGSMGEAAGREGRHPAPPRRAMAAHPRLAHPAARPQGGLDERLREVSLRGLVERDTPGYAIGGLAGGEDKRSFVRCWAAAEEASQPARRAAVARAAAGRSARLLALAGASRFARC